VVKARLEENAHVDGQNSWSNCVQTQAVAFGV
jgi:hypothetical protein